ncbi:MAG: tetratricopeptide repeat protein [Candidatus Obscuribacterales bacterium]|nr:tetratricopeptide repeat protein [Candidatus Obscuribacterales bacterium]
MNSKISRLASCFLSLQVLLAPGALASTTGLGLTAKYQAYEDHRHAGIEYLAEGRYGQAETSMLATLKEAEAFGTKDIRLSQSLKALADFYKLRNQPAKAEPYYERAIRTQEASLGADSSEVIASVVSLIQFRITQNEIAKADRLTEKLIGFASKKVAEAPKALANPDSRIKAATLTKFVDLATACDTIGSIYRLRGNKTLAEPLLQYSLAIREKTLTPGHLALARAYGNMGFIYLNQHKNQEATVLFKKALETSKKTLGENNPLLFSKMDDLGHCYIHTGQYAEAEQLYKQILSKGWNTASCYLALGQTYTKEGQYAAAEQAFKTAISITQKSNGKDTCMISPILEEYSVLLKKTQRYQEAETQLARSKSLKSL